jgi:hypothetical protein
LFSEKQRVVLGKSTRANLNLTVSPQKSSRVTPKSAILAETWMLAFHFIFSKRYFSIYKGISEDLMLATFLTLPEQVKRINTGDSEIIVRQLGGHLK